MSARRLSAAFLLCLASLALRAEIAYVVKADVGAGLMHVSVRLQPKGPNVDLQSPNWGPGSYVLRNNAAGIKNLTASDATGAALEVAKSDDNTWRVSVAGAQAVVVTYDVGMGVQGGVVHYSGPPTYLYVVGRKEEACTVRFELPAGWRIAVGLDEAKGKPDTYAARDYDVLADNPVTMGEFRTEAYTVDGKPHVIAMRGGAKDAVDGKEIVKRCKFITMAERDFFGGLPYNKYIWHFDVADRFDGGGGLEHLSSTQIGLASGLGPRCFDVMAHEFFHLWNVKRIRSKALGPFDYLALPKTGALWWLEGVTDYYASILPLRYGWGSEEYFFGNLINNTNNVRSNPARLEISPYQSSLRVGEANNGRGNSNGYRISYYNLGWLVGLCLDIEIRSQTKGKRSLDDVTRALFEQCRDFKPGFEEDEIRKQCVRFGGASLGDFYDKVVMAAGELPIEAQLAKVGLQLVKREKKQVDTGFAASPSAADNGPKVFRAAGASEGVLKTGDVLQAIDGVSVQGNTVASITVALAKAMGGAKSGRTMTIKLRRGEEVMEVQLTPGESTRTTDVIEELPNAPKDIVELRNGWFYAGKKKISV